MELERKPPFTLPQENSTLTVSPAATSHPDVKRSFVQLDLTDLSSVRAAAKEIGANVEKLNVLINNAGSGQSHGCQRVHEVQRWD
ncbi:MAG: hypothetical protein MMC33_006223 [Icmadophila ericetorum]|nr:hypothetical protein [Icmadophila ericetorum]